MIFEIVCRIDWSVIIEYWTRTWLVDWYNASSFPFCRYNSIGDWQIYYMSKRLFDGILRVFQKSCRQIITASSFFPLELSQIVIDFHGCHLFKSERFIRFEHHIGWFVPCEVNECHCFCFDRVYNICEKWLKSISNFFLISTLFPIYLKRLGSRSLFSGWRVNWF